MGNKDYLLPARTMNGLVANMDEVQREVEGKAKDLHRTSEALLITARATTTHSKIDPETSPPHMTKVLLERASGEYGHVDYEVILEGLNPMAIEYGHAPSGKFAGTPTKSPRGLYILNGAASLM